MASMDRRNDTVTKVCQCANGTRVLKPLYNYFWPIQHKTQYWTKANMLASSCLITDPADMEQHPAVFCQAVIVQLV